MSERRPAGGLNHGAAWGFADMWIRKLWHSDRKFPAAGLEADTHARTPSSGDDDTPAQSLLLLSQPSAP